MSRRSPQQKIVVVASAAIYDHRGWLLLARRDCEKDRGRPIDRTWELPGGTTEPWETPAQAAVREPWEELRIRLALMTTAEIGRFRMGLPASVSSFAAERAGVASTIHMQWLHPARIIEGTPEPTEGVHSDALWLPPQHVLSLVHGNRGNFAPGQCQAIARAARYSLEMANAHSIVNSHAAKVRIRGRLQLPGQPARSMANFAARSRLAS